MPAVENSHQVRARIDIENRCPRRLQRAVAQLWISDHGATSFSESPRMNERVGGCLQRIARNNLNLAFARQDVDGTLCRQSKVREQLQPQATW